MEDVRFTTGNKFGFVKFNSRTSAARAIEVMDGMDIKVIDPCRQAAACHESKMVVLIIFHSTNSYVFYGCTVLKSCFFRVLVYV